MKVLRVWAPLAISLLALFVASGGVGWAASLINGKQIKKHSVPLNRLTLSAIHALAGKKGPPGPRGAAGANGVNGVNGATHVVVRTQTIVLPVAGGFNATVSCNPGEVAVGGGIGESNGAMGGGVISTSVAASKASGKPAADGSVPDAWNIVFSNTAAVPLSETASVVCASP